MNGHAGVLHVTQWLLNRPLSRAMTPQGFHRNDRPRSCGAIVFWRYRPSSHRGRVGL